jgi:predicted CoA-binding protein
MKNTLVLGASTHTNRFSHMAVLKLRKHGHPVIAVGKHTGAVGDVEVVPQVPPAPAVHTVTMYLNPAHQGQYEDAILALKPRRVIFNPGAENPEFAERLRGAGVEVREDCTLVMLDGGEF